MRAFFTGLVATALLVTAPHAAQACQGVIKITNETGKKASIVGAWSRQHQVEGSEDSDEGYNFGDSCQKNKGCGRRFIKVISSKNRKIASNAVDQRIVIPFQRFPGAWIHVALQYKLQEEITKEKYVVDQQAKQRARKAARKTCKGKSKMRGSSIPRNERRQGWRRAPSEFRACLNQHFNPDDYVSVERIVTKTKWGRLKKSNYSVKAKCHQNREIKVTLRSNDLSGAGGTLNSKVRYD